ncbi:MAG TPA: CCA tRNA nucleotidyltransferase [Silvibacterium sp.]|jgi:tRNA nucleotidyltransferase/poly(A) polymerase|nr:CCA tRNA nucleotidyltransferase [Silvibacterium sp.]
MPDYVYLLQNRLSPAQQNALTQVRNAALDHGMTVFLTGGAVRDLTTGFPVRDLDFSVHGNALKLKKSLEKAGLVLWGEHEPSRTLFFWLNGVTIEVSSTRREEFPKPGKPVYYWATILEDLRRRDFTANAMAISLNEGSYGLLLDPLNGIADLEARTLRLVSNYGFIEDPSRLLRAVRFQSRTGWNLEERTKVRYDNAKESGAIEAISPYLAGYELEEIGHEEDAFKALKAIEDEGWMKHLYPAWTIAKADVAGLEALHQTLIQLLIQGIHPDLSAAQMELLTAKMQPKDLAALKKKFPRQGFVEYWERLDESAKEFQKELLDKKNAAPSATWRLLTSWPPEPILWLAYTSKNGQVQAKFKNFFTVWPEARQKIPTALMLEMRIAPELPGYQDLVQEVFYQLMDEKLGTEEEMRAFLEPHSPPAPPPPVKIGRSRAKRGEARLKLRDEDEEAEEEEEEAPVPGLLDEEAGELEEVDAEGDEEEEEESAPEAAPIAKGRTLKATPSKPEPPVIAEDKAAKAAPQQKASAIQKPGKKPAASAGGPVASAKKHVALPSPTKPAAKKAAEKPTPAPHKTSTKASVKGVKKVAKSVKKPVKKPAPRPAAKPVRKPVAKPIKKKR